MHLLFDLNELNGRNCNTTNPANGQPNWCVGEWDMSNVATFLQWIHDQGLYDGGVKSPLIGFELGNELAGHLDPVVNTQDIQRLSALVGSIWSDVPAGARPPVYAPSTDACSVPAQLEIMSNITSFATGYTYHAYPGQSGEGIDSLTDILLNSTWLRNGILTGSDSIECLNWWNAGPRSQGLALWITEASSSWSTTLPPPAQNSFIHGFFTIPELGQYAASGVGMIGRWAFSEPSPFGLIIQNSSRSDGGTWDVAADYFVYVAFNTTRSIGSGSGVLAVLGDSGSDALVYAHCSPNVDGSGAFTLMAVNPSDVDLTLDVTEAGTGASITSTPRLEWVFTAPGGNLSSTTPVLNGNEASPLRVGADGSLPPMQPAQVPSGGPALLTLPARSQAFFVLQAAGAAACPGATR